jgi:hypothetical protein
MLVSLESRLKQRLAAGVVTALIVDEVQALPDDLLEEVRLLVNIESDTDKLLPVVLVGQAEMADRLNEPAFAAIKQRVALRCELLPLTTSETAQYIATRIRIAGGTPSQVFTREAVDLIHERSGGIPRTISVVCDNALVTGFAAAQRPVGSKLVLEVCRDFDLKQDAEADSPQQPIVEPPRQAETGPEAQEPPPRIAPPIDAALAAQRAAAVAAGADSPLFGMFDRSQKSWFWRARTPNT